MNNRDDFDNVASEFCDANGLDPKIAMLLQPKLFDAFVAGHASVYVPSLTCTICNEPISMEMIALEPPPRHEHCVKPHARIATLTNALRNALDLAARAVEDLDDTNLSGDWTEEVAKYAARIGELQKVLDDK